MAGGKSSGANHGTGAGSEGGAGAEELEAAAVVALCKSKAADTIWP